VTTSSIWKQKICRRSVHSLKFISLRHISQNDDKLSAQDVSKMFIQTSRLSSSHQNKKLSYKHMSGSEVLGFNLNIAFENKYLIIWYCSNKWHNLAWQLPNLITVNLLLFIKSQFATDVQNYYTWINLCMDTSHRVLFRRFKCVGEVANGLTGIKNALVKCVSILNWSSKP
jgi:hypothetical protein